MDAEKNISERQGQFSIFEGDLVNRGFAKIGIGARKPLDLFLRIVILITVTWVPMAIFAYYTPLRDGAHASENFFYDFAAYAQFFIGIPLFIIAERMVSENLLSAARDFSNSGVVADEDKPRLAEIEQEVAVSRRNVLHDCLCIALGFVLAFATIGPELHSIEGMRTWHVDKSGASPELTWAGWWEMFVALPIQIYWWVRWMWKIGLWYWYLSQLSKFKLVLVASHPDHTGGISFLSEVQAKFAIVILAFGISNVVATVGYKIAMEHAPIILPPVWGPVVGFVIGAPLIFLSPLLLFTKQLHRTKKRALDQFREKAMHSAMRIEQRWLYSPVTPERDAEARNELSQLNLLTGFYERISGMRVVPFDLRSAAQLIGSAVGPVIPLIPQFVKMPEPWANALEIITKWLPH